MIIVSSDYLSIILSALYAKVLVVLGVAFPITEIVCRDIGLYFYQGFYLFLYLGCILFITYMYGSLVREKILQETLVTSGEFNKLHYNDLPKHFFQIHRWEETGFEKEAT